MDLFLSSKWPRQEGQRGRGGVRKIESLKHKKGDNAFDFRASHTLHYEYFNLRTENEAKCNAAILPSVCVVFHIPSSIVF